jgi:hypothetical protein
MAEAAQRGRRRLAQGLWQQMTEADRQLAKLARQRALNESEALFGFMDKEQDDVGPGNTSGSSSTP